MARPQQSTYRLVGSSFTIKNILNLPDNPKESQSQEKPNRNALGHDTASPPTLHSITVPLPPPPSRANITRQFDRRGLGVKVFARWYAWPTHPGFDEEIDDMENCLKLQRWAPKRQKKQRPLFLQEQVQKMEKEFDSKKYLTEGRRAELAVELELTETQVKTWFQNRRTKWRKELRNENPPREVPDGRLKYSIEARKRT